MASEVHEQSGEHDFLAKDSPKFPSEQRVSSWDVASRADAALARAAQVAAVGSVLPAAAELPKRRVQ